MADRVFRSYSNGLMTGYSLNWGTDTILQVGVDTADDDPDITVDDFYDDIAAAGRVDIMTLATVTVLADGTVDIADQTSSSVTGDQFEELIYVHDAGGAETADRLLLRIDSISAILPTGGDINYSYNASGLWLPFPATN